MKNMLATKGPIKALTSWISNISDRITKFARGITKKISHGINKIKRKISEMVSDFREGGLTRIGNKIKEAVSNNVLVHF